VLARDTGDRGSDMFSFVSSMFGCSHQHCTFPITAKRPASVLSQGAPQGAPIKTTYIVCLDCGQEFPYDWKQMKMVPESKRAA
jgi:hypothetical protein